MFRNMRVSHLSKAVMKQEFILCVSLWEIGYAQLVPFFNQDHRTRHSLFTPEYLAGQYAYYASTARDAINKRTFKDELKFLKEMGINFNLDEALDCAVKLSKMISSPDTRLKWC